MWPILTLSFLLQLTDEEQLFAQQIVPVIQPTTEQCGTGEATPTEGADAISWLENQDEEA
ncbi:MAG: hypothetical protein ACOH13_04070 [Flavobacteriales bacterium]